MVGAVGGGGGTSDGICSGGRSGGSGGGGADRLIGATRTSRSNGPRPPACSAAWIAAAPRTRSPLTPTICPPSGRPEVSASLPRCVNATTVPTSSISTPRLPDSSASSCTRISACSSAGLHSHHPLIRSRERNASRPKTGAERRAGPVQFSQRRAGAARSLRHGRAAGGAGGRLAVGPALMAGCLPQQ